VNLVEVVNRTRAAVDGEAVARLVARVLALEGVDGAELTVAFVGDRRMRALNRDHRGRDEVTDVLSFPIEDEVPRGGAPDPSAPPLLLGDVVVDLRQALRQARAAGLPPSLEVALLLVHGVLHLLGYDHEVDAGEMAARQAALLEEVDWEALRVAPR